MQLMALLTVWGEEKVIGDFQEGHFCMETTLKWSARDIRGEVDFEFCLKQHVLVFWQKGETGDGPEMNPDVRV